ncbi:MAG: hypothetical protein R3E34_00710 [Rhodocyclaceae bacterium]
MCKRAFMLLLAVAMAPAMAGQLRPFASDGCSAFPDGTPAQRERWLGCCRAHDLAYWQGGTAEQRGAADEALRQCVADVGEPAVAALMLAGVRVGGTPFAPTPFRWGYGWPFGRGYQALNESEKAQVKALLPGDAPAH